MLDAKDLRIGNLILVHNHYVATIERIGKDIGVKTYGEKISQIDYIELQYLTPIELTDEWLLRFGFEVDDDLGDQIYYQIPNQKNGYGICFDHDDIAFYKFYGNGGENVHTLIHDEEHLQYVHQLQNLYYALTQTELTLKDEK